MEREREVNVAVLILFPISSSYRSLVRACLAIEMQEAIAVAAQGAAGFALNNSRRFAIVVVAAHGTRVAELRPLAGGKLLDMITLQHAEAGQCQPKSRGLCAVFRCAIDLLQPG